MNQEYEGKIRQIITRAVCAVGKKRFVKQQVLKPEHRPDEVLGYWVGNHQFSAKSFHECVVITGKYEITVWYSYEDGSKTDLLKQTFSYSEQIFLEEIEGRLIRDEEVLVTERIEPTCLAAKVKDENINLEIENAFTVEIIGEAKMTIVAYSPGVLASVGSEHDIEEDEQHNFSRELTALEGADFAEEADL